MSPDAHQPDEAVRLDVDQGIAVLTLNRPRSLNALSHEVMSALARRLDMLDAMPSLRAVVLTGSGRAFSAGGDLLEFEQALGQGGEHLLARLSYNQDVIQRLEDLPVPVIGAVNGFAVAGGLEMLLCCDLLVAAEGARLGDGHARYGIVPAGGATVRLLERLAPAHAARLFYTAELVDAATAMRWGLVDDVVAPEALHARCMDLAREIAARSPQALRHIKALVHPRTRNDGRAQRLNAELEHFAAHLHGTDLQRGLAAFRAKHDPQF
jgi:enoyl-CoA hydratase/carnithine racemase